MLHNRFCNSVKCNFHNYHDGDDHDDDHDLDDGDDDGDDSHLEARGRSDFWTEAVDCSEDGCGDQQGGAHLLVIDEHNNKSLLSQ